MFSTFSVMMSRSRLPNETSVDINVLGISCSLSVAQLMFAVLVEWLRVQNGVRCNKRRRSLRHLNHVEMRIVFDLKSSGKFL
jgi:hypothetical protein